MNIQRRIQIVPAVEVLLWNKAKKGESRWGISTSYTMQDASFTGKFVMEFNLGIAALAWNERTALHMAQC